MNNSQQKIHYNSHKWPLSLATIPSSLVSISVETTTMSSYPSSIDHVQNQNTDNNNNTNSTLPFSSYYTLNNFDPYALSITSIVISVLFILVFVIVLAIFGVFVHRKRKLEKIVRNQQTLLSMSVVLLVVQCIGLLIRTIFDAVNMTIVSDFDIYFQNQYGQEQALKIMQSMKSNVTALQAGVSSSKITALYVVGTFEIFTFLLNVVFIPLIVNFVTFVFLKTVQLAKGQFESRQYKAYGFIVNVIGNVMIVVMFLLSFIVTLNYLLGKFKLFSTDVQLYIYLVLFVIYTSQIILQTIAFNIVSFRVLRLMSKNSAHSQKPFKQVIALQIGLTLGALIQVLATGSGAFMEQWVYCKLIYYILNCLGIVIFTALLIPLFKPLFKGTVEELQELNPSKVTSDSALTSPRGFEVEMKEEGIFSPTNNNTTTSHSASSQ
ncbi:hypothetical protein C9374_005487 [Naegleria lovaniensis]|uniref:Uncharacterized protein n=1 Tax=Naegleria lovaniensis TaxID=51637 RepID=A0AA88GL88_NAELO|nr:uncharacterized protein C9374_005487 [Naegleria lovaniensis]KAG2382285.1 hypothetical protein C9374_005487 [Naegleria lovaniensis]